MKTGSVICGIIATSAIVCTGAVFSGVNARLRQKKKKQAAFKSYKNNVAFYGNFSKLPYIKQDRFVSFQQDKTINTEVSVLFRKKFFTPKKCKINVLTGIK